MDNCGIECVREYLRLIGMDPAPLIEKLHERLRDKGLSIFDLTEVLNQFGLKATAWQFSDDSPTVPFIAYSRKAAHFMLVLAYGRTVKMYDSLNGYLTVSRCFLPRRFARYVILLPKDRAIINGE